MGDTKGLKQKIHDLFETTKNVKMVLSVAARQ